VVLVVVVAACAVPAAALVTARAVAMNAIRMTGRVGILI
jgi:hypothetical protein